MSGPEPLPRSYLLSLSLTALFGLVLALTGLAAIFARRQLFGLGIGAVLICYGAAIMGIAWAVWRRASWSWGLMIAAALLNLLTAGSLIGAGSLTQLLIPGCALVISGVTFVAAMLPGTRSALGVERRPDGTA